MLRMSGCYRRLPIAAFRWAQEDEFGSGFGLYLSPLLCGRIGYKFLTVRSRFNFTSKSRISGCGVNTAVPDILFVARGCDSYLCARAVCCLLVPEDLIDIETERPDDPSLPLKVLMQFERF